MSGALAVLMDQIIMIAKYQRKQIPIVQVWNIIKIYTINFVYLMNPFHQNVTLTEWFY